MEEAALAAATALDGMRVVARLGVRFDDLGLAQLLSELGHRKPLETEVFDVELKKVGVRFSLRDGVLTKVIFEIRRAWTGNRSGEVLRLRSLSAISW